jgi:hypothetical protein
MHGSLIPVLQETDEPCLIDRVEKGPDIRIEDVVHLLAGDPDNQGVQRIVLTAPCSEPIREPEEVLLVAQKSWWHCGQQPFERRA